MPVGEVVPIEGWMISELYAVLTLMDGNSCFFDGLGEMISIYTY